MKKEGIRVEGHCGTWYVIAEEVYDGKTLYLLEHEQYGDEAACVIVDDEGNLVLDDVWNGFEDYEDCI
jgi:hypothetical protein